MVGREKGDEPNKKQKKKPTKVDLEVQLKGGGSPIGAPVVAPAAAVVSPATDPISPAAAPISPSPAEQPAVAVVAPDLKKFFELVKKAKKDEIENFLKQHPDMSLDIKDNDGLTPLMFLAKSNIPAALEIMNLLLEQPNIDLEIKNKNDMTAFTYARNHGHWERAFMLALRMPENAEVKQFFIQLPSHLKYSSITSDPLTSAYLFALIEGKPFYILAALVAHKNFDATNKMADDKTAYELAVEQGNQSLALIVSMKTNDENLIRQAFANGNLTFDDLKNAYHFLLKNKDLKERILILQKIVSHVNFDIDSSILHYTNIKGVEEPLNAYQLANKYQQYEVAVGAVLFNNKENRAEHFPKAKAFLSSKKTNLLRETDWDFITVCSELAPTKLTELLSDNVQAADEEEAMQEPALPLSPTQGAFSLPIGFETIDAKDTQPVKKPIKQTEGAGHEEGKSQGASQKAPDQPQQPVKNSESEQQSKREEAVRDLVILLGHTLNILQDPPKQQVKSKKPQKKISDAVKKEVYEKLRTFLKEQDNALYSAYPQLNPAYDYLNQRQWKSEKGLAGFFNRLFRSNRNAKILQVLTVLQTTLPPAEEKIVKDEANTTPSVEIKLDDVLQQSKNIMHSREKKELKKGKEPFQYQKLKDIVEKVKTPGKK